MFSVIRNASAPFGTADEARPNISTTRWRTVADLTEGRYFYESTTSPSVVGVELSQLDLSEGNPELHLDVVKETDHVGNVTAKFVPADQDGRRRAAGGGRRAARAPAEGTRSARRVVRQDTPYRPVGPWTVTSEVKTRTPCCSIHTFTRLRPVPSGTGSPARTTAGASSST